MPLGYLKPDASSDLGQEMQDIEFGDENGILANTEKLIERLKGINDSYLQRDNSFMLLNGINGCARSKTDIRSCEIKRALYAKHNIAPTSRVWDLMQDREQLAAINISVIVGQPEWLVFRINYLNKLAKEAGMPLSITEDEIRLPKVVLRISSDFDLAVFYPSMSCDGSCERKNIDRVLSTFIR